MADDRNWDDPQYKEWRLKVYRRDNFRCQFPGCNVRSSGASKKMRLQAHHIKRWADYPELRFQVTNGVTLCRACHKKVEGQEHEYEPLFLNIVYKKASRQPDKRDDTYLDVKRLLYRRDTTIDDDV